MSYLRLLLEYNSFVELDPHRTGFRRKKTVNNLLGELTVSLFHPPRRVGVYDDGLGKKKPLSRRKKPNYSPKVSDIGTPSAKHFSPRFANRIKKALADSNIV